MSRGNTSLLLDEGEGWLMMSKTFLCMGKISRSRLMLTAVVATAAASAMDVTAVTHDRSYFGKLSK